MSKHQQAESIFYNNPRLNPHIYFATFKLSPNSSKIATDESRYRIFAAACLVNVSVGLGAYLWN